VTCRRGGKHEREQENGAREAHEKSMRAWARERGHTGLTGLTGEGKTYTQTHKLCNPGCGEIGCGKIIRIQPVISGLAILIPLVKMPYNMPNIVSRYFLD